MALLSIGMLIPEYRLDAQHGVAVAHTERNDTQSMDELLARRISLTVTNVSLRRAIDSIAHVAKVIVQYREPVLDAYPAPVSIRVVDVPLGIVFERLFDKTKLRVASDGQGDLAVVTATRIGVDSVPRVGTLVGRIVDSATGRGVNGATVKVAGAKRSVITSDSGRFTMPNVLVGEQEVSARVFGYRPAVHSVTVRAEEQASVRIMMVSVPTMLSGVVTTAAGTQRKIEVGNDITTINADSIMRVAPINSLTDLLETRVPGLTVLHSSGTPGDPSRLRLRGAGSITGNNDPIMIVDGVRVYANQSDTRNSTLAPSLTAGANRATGIGSGNVAGYAAPSPVDQIDPNTIETVEVFKGPSATALYGSDAANGVIVITTKRGRAGPTHWNVSLGQGVNWLPGKWPDNYYRFGLNTINAPDDAESILGPGICVWYDTRCQVDSTVAFQALNDPRYTVFSHGIDQNASATVSGGAQTLSYSLTGSLQRTGGNLRLPGIERERYETFYGPIPRYLIRPDHYYVTSGSGSLTAQPSSSLNITIQSTLLLGDQQRSSLETAISQLQGRYINPDQLAIDVLINDEYERATDHQLTSTNGVQLDWQLFPRVRLHGTGGVQTIQRTDETYIPYGVNSASPGSTTGDTTGSYGLGRGTSQVVTMTVGTIVPTRLVNTAVGLNYTGQSTADVSAYTNALSPGVSQPTDFPGPSDDGAVHSNFQQSTTAASTYGWYAQPTLNVSSRFFVSPGFRLDGGSASGSNAGLTSFPKLDFSYLAVDNEHPFGAITLLRPRLALGYAGTQPNPIDRLRLFNASNGGSNRYLVSLDGGLTQVPIAQLATLGNTRLRPERSSEIEGGIDANLWNDRVQVTATYYTKTRHDAIISIPVPPSVSGSGIGGRIIDKNIGVVGNRGTELSLTTQLLNARAISWSATANFSRDANQVIRLNPGESTVIVGDSRVEVGYPLWGAWAQPIVSYTDANQNGIIDYNEIRLGDSATFVGQADPKYQLAVSNTLTLFNGRLSVNANISYENGLTQTQGELSRDNTLFLNLPNTPGSSLATQAAVVAGTSGDVGDNTAGPTSNIGLIQTVNVLRFNSVSITYLPPTSILRLLRVPTLSVSVQGSNLGIHSNYRGADPNVNAFSTASAGDVLLDVGQLPQPRTWTMVLRVGY